MQRRGLISNVASTFSKYAFGRGGGGHKKEYAVYTRENDDNYGRSLSEWLFDQAVHFSCCLNLNLNLFFRATHHSSLEQHSPPTINGRSPPLRAAHMLGRFEDQYPLRKTGESLWLLFEFLHVIFYVV